MEPDIVPDKLKNPINLKIVSLIILIAVGIYVVLNLLNEDDVGNPIFALSVIFASAVSISSFVIAKRYWGTQVFGKSYLSLGFAYASYAIAEVLYYTFDLILGIEPYPSVADVFFFALYPLTFIHLILNIKFFSASISNKSKIWLILFPILVLIFYGYVSLTELGEPNFDFYVGILFVGATSVVLGFAVYGASIFRQGLLGIAWLLLVIGVLINAIADLWYYQLELYGQYYDTHPVTIIWYASNMLMVYALYKHQKII